jgi:hypothetical protein
VAGVAWLASASPARCALGLTAAAVLGWIKGRYVLTPRAAANARRIEASADRAPLVSFFAPSAWALVLVMIAGGRAAAPQPASPARGWRPVRGHRVALLTASRAAWQEWRQQTS